MDLSTLSCLPHYGFVWKVELLFFWFLECSFQYCLRQLVLSDVITLWQHAWLLLQFSHQVVQALQTPKVAVR